MSGTEGPLSQQQIDVIVAKQPTERSGDFFVSHEHERSCIDGLGLWMLEAVESLDAYDVHGLVSSVGKLFVEAIYDISQIVCGRGSSNEPVDQLQEVLLHELARMDTCQFFKVLH